MKAETTMILAMIQEKIEEKYRVESVGWQQVEGRTCMIIVFDCGFRMRINEIEQTMINASKCGQFDLQEFIENLEYTIEQEFMNQIKK